MALLNDDERAELERQLSNLDDDSLGRVAMIMQLRSDPALVLRANDTVEALNALTEAVKTKEIPEDKDFSPEIVKAIRGIDYSDIAKAIGQLMPVLKGIAQPNAGLAAIAQAINKDVKADMEAVALLVKAINGVSVTIPTNDALTKAVKETNTLLRDLIATLKTPKEFETNRQGQIIGLRLQGFDA